MQQSRSSTPTPQILQSAQPNSVSQVEIVSNTVLGLLIIAFSVCLVSGVFLYRKYSRGYRAAVLLRQIEALERMWQINQNK